MKNGTKREPQQSQYLLTAYILAAFGAWVFLIQPLFLGTLAEAYQLNPRQIGYLAAIEMAGAALTSISAPFWINRINRRHIAVFGICMASLGNFLTICAPDFNSLLLARCGTAFRGTGVVYAMGISMLGETENPDRYFGIGLTLQVWFGSAGLVLLPHVVSLGGAPLMLAVSGGLYLIALPFLRWVPVASIKRAPAGLPPANRFGGLNAGIVLTLLSFLALQAASGAYWAFIERIGFSAQLSTVAIGTYLGAATLVGALGAVTAGLLGTRFGRGIPLAAGFICYAAGLAFINLPVTGLTFAVSVLLFNYAWNLIIPYQFGLLSHFDTTGRFMVVSPAMQASGIAAGPLLASQFITGDNFVRVSHTSFILMILAMVALASVVRRVTPAKEGAGEATE